MAVRVLYPSTKGHFVRGTASGIGGCQPPTSNLSLTFGGGEAKDGEKTGNVLPGGPRDKLAGHGSAMAK